MRLTFLILTLMSVSFCFTGCTEEQMLKADQAVKDANSIASGLAPIAPVVPAPWGLYLLLATNLVTAGTAAYEKWRKSQLAWVTKSIVQGVSAAETVDANAATIVKGEIKTAMSANDVLSAGNIIVEQLKNQ